jgi:hypothetical protein
MSDQPSLIAPHLRAPRAAAIAGIVFSGLLITSLVLLRRSVPADPLEAGAWLRTNPKTVAVSVHLLPFAGIAFLWFMGVLRDRLGARQDPFFATVFLGSGLLFLALLFTAAAISGALITAFASNPERVLGSATYTLGRAIVFEIMNLYAIKMAAVFMVATSTLALRTHFISRWIALLGYVLALALLMPDRAGEWMVAVFPLWVLLVSVHILAVNLRRATEPDPSAPAGDRLS